MSAFLESLSPKEITSERNNLFSLNLNKISSDVSVRDNQKHIKNIINSINNEKLI
jgi:ribosomal protein L30/L7E